jgi:hypothetical protein
MTRRWSRQILLSLLALTTLAVPALEGAAQGFDPSKVDWEALSKIPMRDSFIKQFNDQCAVCHGENHCEWLSREGHAGMV